MEVREVFWWKHNCPAGQYSTAKVHRSLKVTVKEGNEEPKCYEDYTINLESLPGLEVERIEGV